MSALDQKQFRQLMGNFCTGIVIVTSQDENGPIGFTAQSFVSLSLEPPLIAVCPAKTASTWARIRQTNKFGINILCASQRELANNFASPVADRFADVNWSGSLNGLPIIKDSIAFIDCALYAEHDAGDHTIAVGEVLDYSVFEEVDSEPLLYFRGQYRRTEAIK